MRISELNALANKYKTDKGSIKHNYIKYYDEHLKEFRYRKYDDFKLLKIGTNKGQSVKMWLDYFNFGKIYGLDLNGCNLRNERFIEYVGNQSSVNLLNKLVNDAGKFDIIIDDGSHRMDDQFFCLKFLFKYLKDGGLYIIEDLNCKRSIPFIDKIKKFKETGDIGNIYLNNKNKKINIYEDKICFIWKTGEIDIQNNTKSEIDIQNNTKSEIYIQNNTKSEHIINEIPFEFTTTATIRPEIHEITYKSFYDNLTGVDFSKSTLYLNIDPLPKFENTKIKKDKINECIKVAKKYFGKLVVNTPRYPNYTQAYNWVWSKPKGEFIFNLEDDWELIEKVSIFDLLYYFDNMPNLYEVVLRAYSYIYTCCCTSPCIFHERFYKKIAGKLDKKKNPENQIHVNGHLYGLDFPFKANNLDFRNYVVSYPDTFVKSNHIIVKDLGRKWMNSKNYKRPDKKCRFVKWEEVKN